MIDKEKVGDELDSILERMDEIARGKTKRKEFKQLRKRALELQQMPWRAR